jgi:hypothetical protein
MSGHDDTLYACACAFLARCGEFLSSDSSNIEALDRATNVCIRRSDYIVRDLDRSSREIPANHTAAQQPSHQSHYSLVLETWRRNSFRCAILTGVTDGKVSFNLHLYLDGNGHSLTLSTDTNDVLGGIGLQQSSGPFPSDSFNGAYALGVTGTSLNETEEFYAAGLATATGNGGTLSGMVDLGLLFTSGTVAHAPVPVAGAPVSGQFSSNSNGVFTGTITGVDLTTCPSFSSGGSDCTSDAFTYYLIDTAGDNILIETDTNQLTLGYLAQR